MTPKAPAYLTVAAHYAKKGMTLQVKVLNK